jgi:hypothetical protein
MGCLALVIGSGHSQLLLSLLVLLLLLHLRELECVWLWRYARPLSLHGWGINMLHWLLLWLQKPHIHILLMCCGNLLLLLLKQIDLLL